MSDRLFQPGSPLIGSRCSEQPGYLTFLAAGDLSCDASVFAAAGGPYLYRHCAFMPLLKTSHSYVGDKDRIKTP
jgi:hypothetical protein